MRVSTGLGGALPTPGSSRNARNTASIELHERFGFEEITRRFSFPGLTFKGGEGILFRLRLHRTEPKAGGSP